MSREAYLKRRYGGSQSFLNKREHQYVADMLARIGPQQRVLDLPSGHGRFTPQLRQCASAELVCGDHDLKHLRALIEAESDQGTSISVKEVDLYAELPFADNEFDLVFNFRFFHHIEENWQRELVVRELVRVSKRYLIVSYYHTARLHSLQKKLWRRKGHKRSLPMIPVSEFHRLFNNQNCEVLEDRAILPGVHANRVVLLEKRNSQAKLLPT